MSGFEITRRGFMMGCSSAVAAMAGSRFNSLVFAQEGEEYNDEILLTVFLRGGMDALNFMPPLGDEDRSYYEPARGVLSVTADNAMQLGTEPFMLHPRANRLRELYMNGDLALIPASGMYHGTRSHFDAMAFMEMGTPGTLSTASGWLARHLATTKNIPDEVIMPALAAGHYSPTSFLSSNEVVSFDNPAYFNLNLGPWMWQNAVRTSMRQLYSMDNSPLYLAGERSLNAADVIESYASGTYTPSPGVTYPDHTFGNHLQIVAQMIKAQVGLRVATVDLGGWDTHEGQGNDPVSGYFDNLVGTLSDGLHAFYSDMVTSQQDHTKKLTIVVMSEFGRRFHTNGDNGTDHGHGGIMMVLGGNVNGGIHGRWPTLHPDALYEGIDLDVTTDYRQVLSEILVRRLNNPNIDQIFPNYYIYHPLGVMQGKDMEVTFDTTTAVDLNSAETNTPSANKALTAAGVGLAATAGLLALRERGRNV